MRSNYKKLGDYVRQVNVRNTDGKIEKLVGVNLDKKFMPSVANIIGADLTKYKVVKKGQFGCKFMSVGRDGKLPISLMREHDEAIISSAYYVFEVKDENELLSEYLMMWLSRSENDRYLWFISGADVRGSISWDDFCSIDINVPSIEKQREIVKEYHTIIDRIKLNEQLNQKLEDTAQSIYKEWLVNFEFPDENGKPYKSNGGEMEYSDKLDMEIPKGWKLGIISDLFELQRGFDLPSQDRVSGQYPIYAATGVSEYHNEYKVKAPSVITGRSGSLGEVFYVDEDFWALNTTLWIKSFKNATPIFSYFVLKSINLIDYNGGSAVPTLNRNHLHMDNTYIPNMDIIEEFEVKAKKIFQHKKLLKQENEKLKEAQKTLLSKMATVKD